MATLQERISSLITAIGADIKALQGASYDLHNASVTAQTVSGNSDNYIAGSLITIPAGKVKVGTKYRVKFNVVKTAAGTAAPTIKLLIGTLGTTSDTARNTLTFAAQTGAIDEGDFECEFVFRVAGASAVIQGLGRLLHRLITTGLNVTGIYTSVLNTGAAFDVTTATKIGIAVNPGASASWTVSLAEASVENLTR